MIVTYLLIALILSFVNIIILMIISSKRTVSYNLSMFHIIAMAIAGHFFLAMSSNIEEALLANKLAYAGAVYVPLLFFLGELNICNVKISKALRIGLFCFSTLVLGFAITTGWSDIFYVTDSVKLITHQGATDYTVEFGPAHLLYNALLLFYLVSGISVFLHSILKKRNISYRNLLALVAIGFVGIATFILFRELHYDMLVMPAIYLILEYILLMIVNRVSKYDIQGTILDTLEFQNESAYILFSEDLRYIGSNDIALHNFPVLKDFRVDAKIPEASDFGDILLNQIKKFNNDTILTETFQYGKHHYKCMLRNLIHGKKSCGYIFRIEDDTKMQRYIKLLDEYNNNLVTDVQNKDNHIQAMQRQMILGMANMVESRDSNTGGHIRRTSQAVSILVNEMRKDDAFRSRFHFFDDIIKAAPMHDLGKIAVDDVILRKPGKFTPEEFEIMKTHAEKGSTIVENLLRGVESEGFVNIARNVANFHHEKWDGTGYPRNLKGEEIPLEARIMAIVDVYDALVSRRCYKERMSHADAYNIIVDSMGTHFDPNLEKFFISCHKELQAFYDNSEE